MALSLRTQDNHKALRKLCLPYLSLWTLRLKQDVRYELGVHRKASRLQGKTKVLIPVRVAFGSTKLFKKLGKR